MKKLLLKSSLVMTSLAIMVNISLADTVMVNSCDRQVEFETTPSRVIVHDLNMNEMIRPINSQSQIK